MISHRVTVCERSDKATWPTRRAAWKEIQRLYRALPDRDYTELAPYKCTVHKGWHIGNRQ